VRVIPSLIPLLSKNHIRASAKVTVPHLFWNFISTCCNLLVNVYAVLRAQILAFQITLSPLHQKILRFFYACIKCGALTESSIEQSTHMSSMADPSRWITDFFFWLFRKGWTTVIGLSIVWYYALVLFFAVLIAWSSKLDSDCIRVGNMALGESGQRWVSCGSVTNIFI
jgi:hypothetical protein